MHTTPNAAAEFLDVNRSQYFARIWEITRKDSEPLRLTDHDRNITYDGELYYGSAKFIDDASPEGAEGTAHRKELEGVKGDTEIRGIVASPLITEADLHAGRFHDAMVIERVVDWRFPMARPILALQYWIDELEYGGEEWVARLNSGASRLQQPHGGLYHWKCPVELGEDGCPVNVASLSLAGSVNTVTSRDELIIYAAGFTSLHYDNYFEFGRIDFTSGPMASTSVDVRWHTDHSSLLATFHLTDNLELDPVAASTLTLVPGCDKTIEMCHTKFSALIDFRGYPHIPGTDRSVQTPTAH